MSTPTSRRPPRGAPISPSVSRTTSQSSRTPERPSLTVEPRSEYLRNALEARMAKETTPISSPIESRPTPQRTASSTVLSSDPWLEQAERAASEDDIPHVQPIRRGRRPSEGGIPRLPTQREQQTTNETLKTEMFNKSLQLELVKKQNNELKDALEEANKRIEELEPLEDENTELRDYNDRLIFKVQDMEDEIIELQKQNKDVLDIQDESLVELERHHTGLEEAAGMILELEKQKSALQEEIDNLKEQLASKLSSNESERSHDAFDGQSLEMRPKRIYSIDESRPSTSNFDSDYWSQPDSPQVKGKTSKESRTFSDRVKAFKDLNVQSKQSLHDLKKRASDVSMKNAPRPESPLPKVPEIPQAYNDVHSEEQANEPVAQTPARYQGRTPQQPTPLKTAQHSSAKPTTVPRTPTTPGPKEGLRGLYREPRTIDKSSRPTSSYKSPTASKGSRRSDMRSHSVVPPQRESSKFAHSSSSEKLKTSSIEDLKTETAPSEYLDGSFPRPPSIETEDLMSMPDNDRWWKRVQSVRSVTGNGIAGLATGLSPTNSRRLQKDAEPLSLFNPHEDEEQFMKRAHSYVPKRK